MSVRELACTYSAVILHDNGIAITAEKISTLLKAANLTVESYWPSLFAKLCEKSNVEDLIMNIGSGGDGAIAVAATGGAAAGSAAAAAAPAVGEKKKVVMLLSCVLVFFLNYSIFLNTTLNSALTQTICDNLKVKEMQPQLIQYVKYFIYGEVDLHTNNVTPGPDAFVELIVFVVNFFLGDSILRLLDSFMFSLIRTRRPKSSTRKPAKLILKIRR